jgi:hypothetical protein
MFNIKKDNLNFQDSYQFKEYIAKLVSAFDISKTTFDDLFANVFMEIYDKEKSNPYIFEFLKISVFERICEEIKNINRKEKTIFLPLFEDYQKLNNEINNIIIGHLKSSKDNLEINRDKKFFFDLNKYPILKRITEQKELETFTPDLITDPAFITFFKANIGRNGIYFLYNLNRDLLFIGKSSNLGETIIDAIWKKDIDGYVSIAYTKSVADTYIYEPYYIIKEKPLLNKLSSQTDGLTVDLKPLEKTELIKIYQNN